MNKYTLTLNIRKMNRLIDEGNKAVAKAAEDREKIREDRDHSDEWKQKRLQEIHRQEQAAIKTAGRNIADLSPYFIGVYDEAAATFDFTDPALQNAMSMVKSFGKALPVAARNNITEHFRGNPTALELLQKCFEAQEMSVEGFKSMRELFTTPRRTSEVLGEIVGYSTSELAQSVQWKPLSVIGLMKDFEAAFGVDSSKNPYMAEIDLLREKPELSDNQRRRIDNFLEIYGEDLKQDEENAMTQAKMRLGEEFKSRLD